MPVNLVETLKRLYNTEPKSLTYEQLYKFVEKGAITEADFDEIVGENKEV